MVTHLNPDILVSEVVGMETIITCSSEWCVQVVSKSSSTIQTSHTPKYVTICTHYRIYTKAYTLWAI
jgi:hypothetical protein